jgi:hypothetical protein
MPPPGNGLPPPTSLLTLAQLGRRRNRNNDLAFLLGRFDDLVPFQRSLRVGGKDGAMIGEDNDED